MDGRPLDWGVTSRSEVQRQCLPLPQVAQRGGSSFCVRRRDLVNVQGKKSHAEAAEEHEQVLGGERYESALQNYVK